MHFYFHTEKLLENCISFKSKIVHKETTEYRISLIENLISIEHEYNQYININIQYTDFPRYRYLGAKYRSIVY